MVAFLKCLGCSDGCTALHHSLLWQDLAPFGFPAHECGSEGLIECFPASLAGGNHKEGTNACVSGVSDLPLLPSLCVRILTDSSALINRLQEPPQSVGSQTVKCRIDTRKTAQAPFSALEEAA